MSNHNISKNSIFSIKYTYYRRNIVCTIYCRYDYEALVTYVVYIKLKITMKLHSKLHIYTVAMC